MVMQIPATYPELLADVAQQVYADLVKDGIKPAQAAKSTWKAIEHARVNIGGISEYIPKGLLYELSVRDREIFEKFKGNNFEELCREYGVSTMRIRQIVAKVLEEQVRLRQKDMFP